MERALAWGSASLTHQVSPSVGMGTHMERARAWGSASHTWRGLGHGPSGSATLATPGCTHPARTYNRDPHRDGHVSKGCLIYKNQPEETRVGKPARTVATPRTYSYASPVIWYSAVRYLRCSFVAINAFPAVTGTRGSTGSRQSPR